MAKRKTKQADIQNDLAQALHRLSTEDWVGLRHDVGRGLVYGIAAVLMRVGIRADGSHLENKE